MSSADEELGPSIPSVALWAVDPETLIDAIRPIATARLDLVLVAGRRLFRFIAGSDVVIRVPTSCTRHTPSRVVGRSVSSTSSHCTWTVGTQRFRVVEAGVCLRGHRRGHKRGHIRRHQTTPEPQPRIGKSIFRGLSGTAHHRTSRATRGSIPPSSTTKAQVTAPNPVPWSRYGHKSPSAAARVSTAS